MSINTFDPGNEDFMSYLDRIHEKPADDTVMNDFFSAEKENSPIHSLSSKSKTDPPRPKEKDFPKETESPFLSSFLTELIHSIKNTLISIRNISQLSVEKFNDQEFRKYAHQHITGDIKKIDSVLNTLLNYININTPIIKSNTISLILEEVIMANGKQIQAKNIKVIQKCEKELPETFIHDEQLRFILNSVLQYAILSTSVNGTLGILVKSFDFQNELSAKHITHEKDGSYIEAAFGFTRDPNLSEHTKEASGSIDSQKEESSKLILRLVRDIIQKSFGSITFEIDPKKPRALITLRFPIERRKVVYYEPISI